MRFFERFYFWKIYSNAQPNCKFFKAIYRYLVRDPRTDWVRNWIARLSDGIAFGTGLRDFRKVLHSELGFGPSEGIGFGTGVRDFQKLLVSKLSCKSFRRYWFRNWVASLSDVFGFGTGLRDFQN